MKKTIFLFLLGAGTVSLQAKNPKNPHWHARTGQAAPHKKSALPVIQFSGEGWAPPITQAIRKLIAQKGNGSSHYDPQKPPIAVLPWENVFIDGDPAELIFWRLARRADFNFSDPFWDIVPIAYGRHKTRAAFEGFKDLPKTIWKVQPTYHQYLKYLLEGYQDQCQETGLKACRTYLARLWIGFSKKELDSYTTIVLNQEKYTPITNERVSEPPEDRAPLVIRRGIRIIPQALNLAEALHQAGFEIWVISPDARPELRAELDWAGLPYAHAGGIDIPLDKKGLFAGTVAQPLPFWGGEIEIIVFHTGRAPALSIGAWPYDQELLDYGRGLKIFMDQGNPQTRTLAVKKGWLIQPSFIKKTAISF